ncbi:thioesterase domain-containing protein [Dactylosporangium sp. NPDC000555]|uniref:thioesterase II family protein n=1 Tax=Dactylosporangium sp. NPDC000555 TaxID=3154260 RepID=UPI0033165B9D
MRLRPPSQPLARMICVPYAGAGANAFRYWAELLPAWLEPWAVRLPARETRLAEPPTSRVEQIAAAIAAELRDLVVLPYCLYGHSMGALVCFELARELRRQGVAQPVHLFVSGRRAPQLPDDLPGICHLPRDAFIAAVRALNGIPEGVLAEPGLMEFIEPALRADFAVCEEYRFQPQPPLAYGISAFGGDADPTTSAGQLAAWREQCAAEFVVRSYPGDHFFVHAEHARILAAICSDLRNVCPSIGGR